MKLSLPSLKSFSPFSKNAIALDVSRGLIGTHERREPPRLEHQAAKEHREHPWLSHEEAERIASDHARHEHLQRKYGGK